MNDHNQTYMFMHMLFGLSTDMKLRFVMQAMFLTQIIRELVQIETESTGEERTTEINLCKRL